MENIAETPYFPVLIRPPCGLKAFLWALVPFLLIPATPITLLLEEQSSEVARRAHIVERGDGWRDGELLKIYSIVRSKRASLDNGSIWAIAETILEECQRLSVDPFLVLAIITVESGFHPSAVSADGARGLMQIQPSSARALARKVAPDQWEGEESLDDPVLNIKLGISYLHSLKKAFKDLKLALAAYNRGPTDVRNRLQEQQEVPLDYATKVLSAYNSYLSSPGSTPRAYY